MNEQSRKHNVHLTGAQATLLLTLYAKAADNAAKQSLLHDAKAAEIVRSIDIDPGTFQALRSDDLIVVRARQYDEWVRAFITQHQDAVVIYLGAGLDTRITRIDPPPTVNWFDVDFPDVIELRRNFYAEKEGYAMIASSITDPAWLQVTPKDRPTMIITEGCLPYLTKEEVGDLLNRLTDHFHNGRIALDVINSIGAGFARQPLAETMGTAHRWIVDDMRDADALDPKLRRIETVPVATSRFVKELRLRSRFLFTFMSLFPQYRDTMRLALYEF